MPAELRTLSKEHGVRNSASQPPMPLTNLRSTRAGTYTWGRTPYFDLLADTDVTHEQSF